MGRRDHLTIAISSGDLDLRSSGCMDYLDRGIRRLVVTPGIDADFAPALPVD